MTTGAYNSILESRLPETIVTFHLIDQDSNDGTREWAKQKISETFIYTLNSPRIALAAAWNQGVKQGLELGADYIGIFNNDIILHPKTIKHMIAFMDETGYLLVTADNIADRMSLDTMLRMELPNEFTDYDCEPITDWRAEGPDFSCYLINKKTIDVIGWFDEGFLGAYCEDQDYHVRIRRACEHAKQHNDQEVEHTKIHAKRLSTAPYYHFASQTVKRNPKLGPEVSRMHGQNHNYYVNKWGAGHPIAMDGKGNIQPFGDATKDWKDW